MYLSSYIEVFRVQLKLSGESCQKAFASALHTAAAVVNPTMRPRTSSESVPVIHDFTRLSVRVHSTHFGFGVFFPDPSKESISCAGAVVFQVMKPSKS